MQSLLFAIVLNVIVLVLSAKLKEHSKHKGNEVQAQSEDEPLVNGHQTFTNPKLHSVNTHYFDKKYFSTLNYSYLNDQTLMRVPKPSLCNLETERFGCKLYSSSVEMVNVTHLHATRLPIDFISKEFPIHNMISLFDWLFVTNRHGVEKFSLKAEGVIWYGQGTRPRTIFIENFLLPVFVEHILPNITSRFVLFSGHNDFTVPYNVDARWDYDSTLVQNAWDKLIASDKVIHWFNENQVIVHPKVSTMPIGMNPREAHPDDMSDHPENVLPLEKRPFMLLQMDRVRSGEQWVQRQIVHDLCVEQPDVCVSGGANIDPGKAAHKAFAEQVTSYPFLLCVHGGGIDPSPKAWESILLGTIPIIEHTTLDDAYRQLPVAFVKNITEFMLSPSKNETMRGWLNHLGPYYVTGSKLRSEVLFKLTTKYWWGRVVSHLNQTIDSYNSLSIE